LQICPQTFAKPKTISDLHENDCTRGVAPLQKGGLTDAALRGLCSDNMNVFPPLLVNCGFSQCYRKAVVRDA
jgi:hypothetical protein